MKYVQLHLKNDEKINLPNMIKPFFDRRGEKRRLSGTKPRLFNEVYREMAKSDGEFIFLSFLKQQFYKKLTKKITFTLMLLFVSLLNFSLQAQNEVAEAFTKPNDPNRIFYLIDEIYAKMDFLANEYPEICKTKYSIGNTYEGRPIYVLKISDNPNIDEDEQAVFYDSCHHGNEKLAMTATVNYMLWLCEQYYANNAEVKYLIDNREIYIIPVVNVDGFIDSKRKNDRPVVESCELINANNGVDLNRNYPVAFGLASGSSTNECASNYCGEFPFSEPETQAIRGFVTSINPTCAFSTHSAGGFVLT